MNTSVSSDGLDCLGTWEDSGAARLREGSATGNFLRGAGAGVSNARFFGRDTFAEPLLEWDEELALFFDGFDEGLIRDFLEVLGSLEELEAEIGFFVDFTGTFEGFLIADSEDESDEGFFEALIDFFLSLLSIDIFLVFLLFFSLSLLSIENFFSA